MKSSTISLYENDSPIRFANKLGEVYASTKTSATKKQKGQFFTPISIATFMGEQITSNKETISILDPGCGTAILSCALIEHLVMSDKALKTIELTVYETDLEIIATTQEVLQHLKEWSFLHHISLSYTLHQEDFILANYPCLEDDKQLIQVPIKKFDYIISNPPYFKLSKEDKQVKAAQCVVDGQPNIYSLFMAVSARLLNANGELIFIVPRSFTSGRYFRLFRNYFLKQVKVDFIHLFNTRRDTFSKDNVLQETLIIKCAQAPDNDGNNPTILSCSEGVTDLDQSTQKVYVQNELINLNSDEKIIHLPINSNEEKIIQLFKSWNGSLNKYNIQISTGPVVAFRAKEYITETPIEGSVKLLWLQNVIKMLTDHPVIKEGKGQYIKECKESKSMLLPNKNYVLLRRFSSKDDHSRLIAAPYFGNMLTDVSIGIENKLNYIYRPKGHLTRAEVMGISALLNSKLFDTFFRTFNGNINVSATELREMPMPPLEMIKAIGHQIIRRNDFSIENVNFVVKQFFLI